MISLAAVPLVSISLMLAEVSMLYFSLMLAMAVLTSVTLVLICSTEVEVVITYPNWLVVVE